MIFYLRKIYVFQGWKKLQSEIVKCLKFVEQFQACVRKFIAYKAKTNPALIHPFLKIKNFDAATSMI